MTTKQQQISNLEKKYMEALWKLFTSEEFKNDLNRLKEKVNADYDYIKENYDKKNKIDIAIERLIRYYVYRKSDFNIIGIYPSPISCDMAIETDDCILNIDSKTIDSVGNKTDINYFHFESNQSSFKHKPYGAQTGILSKGTPQSYDGFPIKTCLPTIYEDKPVLTYFLKVIYADNGKEFSYYKKGNNLSLTCLPNGELSDLFPENIIFNFKTYSYSDGERWQIADKDRAEEVNIKFDKDYTDDIKKFKDELEQLCFEIPFENYSFGLLNIRPIIISEGKIYAPVKRTSKGLNDWFLEEIISGHTARILYPTLNDRVDGAGNKWDGHRTTKINTVE